MKLSNETLTILKNFATINPGILFKSGNTISTMSPQKNILVDAKIAEEFPRTFAIYDLNNFLSVISLFKDSADLEFDDKHVIIKGMGGRSKIKYRFTAENMVVAPPEKRPVLPSVDVTFKLTTEDFNWLLKCANVLGCPHIAITSEGNKTVLMAFDANDNSSNVQSLELDNENLENKVFNLIFKTENLKIIPGDYDVEISSAGIAKFIDLNKNLVYFITIETSSTFN